MDKLNQINKLIDAGFSAEEIRAMQGTAPAAPADPAPQPDPQPADPAPQPAPADPQPAPADPQPAPESKPDYFSELETKIDGLMESMAKIAKTGIMPVIDNIEPKGIDDIVLRFFKED